MESSIDVNCEADLWSLEGENSNAIILPPKNKKQKTKNKKAVNQVPGALKKTQNSKPSNSQKRKLRKLEEEKEKELLLSRSIKTLEKYKIQEDIYSLMWSSRNLSQVETIKEKRLREMQFSKAGLEMPSYDYPFKRRAGNHVDNRFSEVEPDSGKSLLRQRSDVWEPLETHVEVPSDESSLKSPQELVSACVLDTGRSNALVQVKEVSSESNDVYMQEDPLNTSSTFSSNDIKASKLMVSVGHDIANGNPEVTINSMRNGADCTSQSCLAAPTIVHVLRPKEVEKKRKDLPIVMMEQEIMETINENLCVIICGETGCGKTTQVPQFLYEAGFGSDQCIARSGMIGVTQPRRVAVLSTAKRVAFELGLRLGKEVGFQVRHDKRIGDSCSIKFMTDGILLREVQSDFLLRRYSVIILDEAHERSLNTDMLIGMLSRVIQERKKYYNEQQEKVLSGERISLEDIIYPLKLILMSATLRVEDFVSGRRVFPNPPVVIEVPTRQYPVTIHFSKRTEIVDYIGQAYKKVLSIHKRLPAGGILVFVTGQREVEYLCQKLRMASRKMVENSWKGNSDIAVISEENSTEEDNMKEINEAYDIQGHLKHDQTDRFSSFDDDHGDLSEVESDISYDSQEDSELDVCDDHESITYDTKTVEPDGDLLDALREGGNLASLKAAFESLAGKKVLNSGSDVKEAVPSTPSEGSNQVNSSFEEKKGGENGFVGCAMRVLPLYAMLPASAQLRVFEEAKKGERLVVVATNVAETSLTIPGIKYVVDTGREKVKNYNSSNGMETYEVQWISKASASQRAGRAGRTGPGHCYRLYSSAVFNNIFPDFSCAEILKVPVDGVVLLMKAMNIDKVANFPFPTPPNVSALIEAERCLKVLEALDGKGWLTPLGKAMAQYPMSPRHSRMLLTVVQIMRNVEGYARANLVLGYAVAAAAALSLSNPFILRFEATHSDADILKQDGISDVDGEKILNKEDKLRRKKLKETAKVSHAKFLNPNSDTLTIAYALQCFELSANTVEFCNENALHLKTMEEMSKLRKQLLQLVFNQSLCDLPQFSWPHGTIEDVECAWKISSSKHPLLLSEEDILTQAICAGWADRVAKRTRGFSWLSEGERRVNSVRYQACNIKETVYLHRWSSISKSAPEFLVYNELLHTKRSYIHGATSVKPNWLVRYAGSMCSFSAPLADPKPYYGPLADEVFYWVSPTFGPHLWVLPLHSVPIKDDMHRVAVFACSLLRGQVLPCLRSVQNFMAASPAVILRPEASSHKRVGNLLSRLKTKLRTIDSCVALREVWNDNPRELYVEIINWFQEGFHDQFEQIWEEMHREILLDPNDRFRKKTEKRKRP